MWPFDRPSRPIPPSVEEKLDRMLHQQSVLLKHLGLKPDPVPRPASQSLPPKLTESSIHVVTRQDVLRQERANAVQDARRAAGIVPSPNPSQASPSQPTAPTADSLLQSLTVRGGWADTPDQASKTPTSPSSDS